MHLDDNVIGRWRETPDGLPNELPHLRERQLAVLSWVWRHWVAHRHGPTRRGIATRLSASSRTATAAPFVNPLVAKGHLERTPVARRGIRLTTEAIQKLRLKQTLQSKEEAKPVTSE